jgi:hypothetical protein
LTPDKIFNLEEMKVIVNSKGQPKILAWESRSQVGVLHYDGKEYTVTA